MEWALRNYNVEGQLGQEKTIQEYIDSLLVVFDNIKRALKPTGSIWVNLGDTFSGTKKGNTNNAQKDGVNTDSFIKPRIKTIPEKSLCMIPERFAIAMIDRGWILRHKIVWQKGNAMPQSAPDRFSLNWEYLYHFTKSPRYFFEMQYESVTGGNIKEKVTNSTIKFGGNKAKGYNNPTYSGDIWTPTLHISKSDYNNARKLGWDGKSDYTQWYFKHRQKKSYHNHDDDESKGMMQCKRGKTTLAYPFGSKKRSVWRINTKPFPGAHFAVFPEELLDLPIKATCPTAICIKCGHMRKKVYEEIRITTDRTNSADNEGSIKRGSEMDPYDGSDKSELSANRRYISRSVDESVSRRLKDCGAEAGGGYSGIATKDYDSAQAQNPSDTKRRILESMSKVYVDNGLSTCSCDDSSWSRGIILDPFLGSGTSALAALKHGCDFVGIELNSDYIQIAKQRLTTMLDTYMDGDVKEW